MNDTQSSKRGHVVPKWLEFSDALKKRELTIPRGKPFEINEYTKKSIEEEYKEFKQTPSIETASSLLGSAIVVGNESLAREMAVFIKKKRAANKISIAIADKVLNQEMPNEHDIVINLRIAKIKNWIRKFPKSAIPWIELARLYTINGQYDKAKKAAVISLNLAPFDRYIVRSGVRFFLHIFELDLAWHYIHKANLHVNDPWLKATEINVAMIAKKNTPAFKRLIPKDIGEVNLFHYSELYESYGLLEFEGGNAKAAKKLFKTAWTKPCETVITHGEWVIRNMFPGLRENSSLEYKKSLEALTWVKYFELDTKNAIKIAKEWELEEPYSRSPFILGASIACGAGLCNIAVDTVYRGLKANPDDPKLINNLCYSLLRDERVEEAEKEFKKYKQIRNDDENIYYLATKGLLEFKKGNLPVGRNLYLDAIKICKQKGEKSLVARAYLNLSLAELEASTDEANKTVPLALKASEGTTDPSNKLLLLQVLKKLEKGSNLKKQQKGDGSI